MEADTFREACTNISRCYSQARGAQTPPTLEDIKEVTMERAELYMCRPPEGLKVPILVRNTDIKDGIPMEAEVAEAVWGLKGSRAEGPPGISAEDLRGWLREATRTKALVEKRVVTLDEVSTPNVWGQDPTGGACMGNNSPHIEREGGVLGYRTCRGGVEGLCNSGEL